MTAALFSAESGARLAADNELQKSVSDLSFSVRQIGKGIVELWLDLDKRPFTLEQVVGVGAGGGWGDGTQVP